LYIGIWDKHYNSTEKLRNAYNKDDYYYTQLLLFFFNFDNSIIGIIPLTATPTPLTNQVMKFYLFLSVSNLDLTESIRN
jgi:hypothetical protein